MDAFSAAKAKMGAKSGGEAAAAAGLAAPQPAATAPSPAGPGSPSAPEPTAYKLEDLETLATVGEYGGGGSGEEQRAAQVLPAGAAPAPSPFRCRRTPLSARNRALSARSEAAGREFGPLTGDRCRWGSPLLAHAHILCGRCAARHCGTGTARALRARWARRAIRLCSRGALRPARPSAGSAAALRYRAASAGLAAFGCIGMEIHHLNTVVGPVRDQTS